MARSDDGTSNARTFVRLLQFLRPYRSSLIWSTILAILSQAAAIAVIVLTGFVINELKGGQDGHYLAFLILVILGVGLLRALLMLGRRFISGKQALAPASITHVDDEHLGRLRATAARLERQLLVAGFQTAVEADDVCAAVARTVLARYAASAFVAARRKEAAPTMT